MKTIAAVKVAVRYCVVSIASNRLRPEEQVLRFTVEYWN